MIEVKAIRFGKEGYEALVSPLEAQIFETLCRMESSRVRDIHRRLRKTQKVSLTSIAVCLDRLHTKGFVSRTVEKGRGGGRYIYSPRGSRQEVETSIIESAVNKMISSFGDVAVSYFNERFAGRGAGRRQKG